MQGNQKGSGSHRNHPTAPASRHGVPASGVDPRVGTPKVRRNELETRMLPVAPPAVPSA